MTNQAHLRFLQELGRSAAGFVGRDSALIRSLRPLYERLLAKLSHDRGVPWEINGTLFSIDPSCRHMMAHEYEAPVAKFLRSRISAGQTCFDIGANVGVYVLQLASWSGPGGRIIAFEPNPTALRILEKHISLNGIGHQVTVVRKAVGSKSGTVSLFASGPDMMSRVGGPNPLLTDTTRSETELTTLDSYVEATGVVPDWILIDIEGLEISALLGASRLISRRGSATGFVVEFHPDLWASAGTSEAEARSTLNKLGLHILPITGQRDPWREYGSVYLARA